MLPRVRRVAVFVSLVIAALIILDGIVAKPTPAFWVALVWIVLVVLFNVWLGARSQRKTCPDCAEMVLLRAHVCKHCGHRFQSESGVATQDSGNTR